MFNLSPVQGLTQKRDGHFFVNDMLAGEMTLMPRGMPSEWSWKSVCDRLDVMVPADVFGNGADLDVIDRFLFRDLEIERICQNLYREICLAGSADRLYIESLVIHLAGILLQRHSRGSGSAQIPHRGGLTRPQAKRVLEYIESNLAGELTLRELAAVAGLSAYHFARTFKMAMGVTPHRYVLERRVERAKAMLRMTRTTLVDIGLSMGFCGQSHFTTAFRRLTGVTPTEFQECNRRRP
jgi:AraC family transcriptional regulator